MKDVVQSALFSPIVREFFRRLYFLHHKYILLTHILSSCTITISGLGQRAIPSMKTIAVPSLNEPTPIRR